ncbi:MAG: hypothetical protein MJY71_02620 [Bacteroidaceae bacterium]|nr:hypothetical protein [Bacteroidaceae bacterium]
MKTREQIQQQREEFQQLYRQIEQEYNYHHSAIARGYINRGGAYIEDYVGKFGKGVIVHFESNDGRVNSNKHHHIEYHIEKI